MKLIYEDELPDDISDEMYSWWFDNSFVDFVRIGPKLTSHDLEEMRLTIE